jgi:hypothetical protein
MDHHRRNTFHFAIDSYVRIVNISHSSGIEDGHLRLVRARIGVVDLVAPLAALVGPGEVSDGNDEEAISSKSANVPKKYWKRRKKNIPVGAIRNTRKRIVPRQKRGHQSKRTTSHNTTALRVRAIVVEVPNAQQHERHVEREE